MSCFRLPKGTIAKLQSAMSAFWWNSVEHRKKIHWVSWAKMCIPKHLGGLGFKDLETFNQSLLSKQAWKLLQDPSSLFAKVFKSRYYPHSDFLSASVGSRPSFGWRSILFGRELLEKGIKKEIGNGSSIRVWLDPWIQDNGMRTPLIKNFPIDVDLRVSDLIDPITRSWDFNLLRDLFWPVDFAKISLMKPTISKEDFWSWKHNRSGNYTVKSGYWLASHSNSSEVFREASTQPSLNAIKIRIWSIQTEPKIRAFLWRILSDALPVAENILSRGMLVDARCQMCGFEGESANHVLFSCPLARQTWALSLFPLPLDGFHSSSVYVNINYLFTSLARLSIPIKIRRSFPWTLWILWKNRNKFFFEGSLSLPHQLALNSFEDSELWFHAQTIEDHSSHSSTTIDPIRVSSWDRPPTTWLKCNIGVVWCKHSKVAGCSWVLRSTDGSTLLHSRTAFTHIPNITEAKLKGLTWAIEAMIAHNLDRVIFAAEVPDLFGAILRPKAWPNFIFYAEELTHILSKMMNWRVKVEDRSTNRSSFLIANSVTSKGLFQSYVARGHPCWLSNLFEEEKLVSMS